MLNSLKSFLSRTFSKQSAAPSASAVATPAKESPKPSAAPGKGGPAPAKNAGGKTATATAAPAAVASTPDEVFHLPVKVVLSRLQPGQTALVKSKGDGQMALPLKRILAMLPQGSVKLTFGEIRQAAPAGTFLDVASEDQTMVELPLPEILSRLSAAHLSRRPAQKTIEVPPEVGNVFGPRGEQLAQSSSGDTAIRSKPAPAPAPAAASAPAPATPAPKVAMPAAPAPATPAGPKVAAPSLPKPPAPAPAKTTEPAPMISAASLPLPTPSAPPALKVETAAPKIPAPGLPQVAPAAPAVAQTPSAPKISMPQLPQSQPAAIPKQDTAPVGELLTVPLASLIDGWPQNVKDEISSSKLKESSVGLPMERIEVGLKTGKLTFAWKEITSWLKPNSFSSQLNADTNVDLPLKVIAPLFLTQHRPSKAQKKLAIDETIPDLFAGGKMVAGAAAPAVDQAPAPKPALPTVPPVAAPAIPAVPTSTIPKPPSIPTPPSVSPAGLPKPSVPGLPKPAAAPVREPQTLSELFGQAEKMDWSPREIVAKANTLKGIAGSMVALQDGLMVAGELPAPYRAETTAAFLPQIFGRMVQYAKELNLGDMTSLIVECDKAPLQITRAGEIYFGVIGKAGEPLPVGQIKMIATELAKQNK